jgi:Rhs element Vgr protein
MAVPRTIPANTSTDLVTFTIFIEENEISRSYSIQSIFINRMLNKIASARIVITDGDPSIEDFPVSNESTFIPGNKIEIQAGFNSNETSIFKGIITGHSIKIKSSGAPQLIIECRDVISKLTLCRKNKYFTEMTDSGAIEDIAGENNIEHYIEPTNTVNKEIVQFYVSDWDFIVTRAEANGKVCSTDDGKLIVKSPVFSADPKLDVLFGATIIEFDAEMDARYQYAAVTSQSWDYSNQELITASSSEPAVTEEGNIKSNELSSVFNSSNITINHGGSVNENQLQNWADAYLLKSRLAKIQGRVKFRGYHDLKPLDLINLNGVGDRFNGIVFVSGVKHEIVRGGWTTEVKFGLSPKWFAEETDITYPKASALIPAIQGLHTGIVTDLMDPDGECRVKIKIPSISMEEEGTWARVAALDAGANRGSYFRPEIGDEVVVGFFDNDPRYPVILGMLNSSSKNAPITASNDNNEKGFITRSDIRMVFNDEAKSFKLKTPNGKKIILDEQSAFIIIEDEKGNKISFESDGINIESPRNITVKAGGVLTLSGSQLSITGDASLKIDGGASTEIKSSGTMQIEAAMVMIN